MRHVLVWSLRCEPRCHLTNTTTITEKEITLTLTHTITTIIKQSRDNSHQYKQTKLHFFVVVIVQPPFHKHSFKVNKTKIIFIIIKTKQNTHTHKRLSSGQLLLNKTNNNYYARNKQNKANKKRKDFLLKK